MKLRLKSKAAGVSSREVVEDEVGGNLGGVLSGDNDTNIQMSRDNACPYFIKKSEMCLLDGRICLYDTSTFPACSRYAEGVSKHVPGIDGKEPEAMPDAQAVTTKAQDDDTTQGTGQPRPLFRS
jgi:hypothetical protein